MTTAPQKQNNIQGHSAKETDDGVGFIWLEANAACP